MNDTSSVYPLLMLLLGLLLGAIIAWLMARLRFGAQQMSQEELKQTYVRREVYDKLQEQADIDRDDLRDKEEEIRLLTGRISSLEQNILHLEDSLATQKKDMESQLERAQLQFEQLASRLLEEKSQKFTAQNQQQLQDLLGPLREHIRSFEQGIERRFTEETRDRAALQNEIQRLRELNGQLSQDATNLTQALKGDQKIQGNWGEFQLETLLERTGLQKGIHFKAQASFRREDGQQQRPDFLVFLPDDKHLIIDSKVSLLAYEQYFNAQSAAERETNLRAHLESLRRHVRELSEKNYQQIHQINSPDYLLLFVPIEPAFGLAIQHDPRLFLDALDRNIVIVTHSTLMATMRTVSYIWKQEKQKSSVQEIAKQSGLLYDKFCAFVDDLRAIGQRLDQTQSAYQDAINKLVDSKKYGDTLIGRAERIRELGAPATKNLPKEWIDKQDSTDSV